MLCHHLWEHLINIVMKRIMKRKNTLQGNHTQKYILRPVCLHLMDQLMCKNVSFGHDVNNNVNF
jgi:hypothetical protein